MIRNTLFRRAMGMAVAVVLGSCAEVSAAIPTFSNTTGLAYSQNFNTLASTGTANAWANDSTLGGWYAQSQVNNTSSWGGNYAADSGSTAAADLYSYGTTAGDRALGSVSRNPSGSAGSNSTTETQDFFIGLQLRYTGAVNLNQLQVIYRGEQWRDGNSTDGVLRFSYLISSSPITSLTSGTWQNLTTLNFTTPTSTASGSKDGNLSGNSSVKNVAFNLNVPLQQNYYIMLRWNNDNVGSSGHGMAVDDVFVAVPEASTWAAGALAGAAALVGYRRSRRTVA